MGPGGNLPGAAKAAPRHWSWRIASLDDAYRVARESLGGLLFLLGLIIGLIGELVRTTGPEPGQLATQIVLLVIVAFCALRVRSGRGWIAGPLMLVLFAVDAGLRVWSGDLSTPLPLAVSAVILVALAVGAGACWQVRQRERRGETRTAEPADGDGPITQG